MSEDRTDPAFLMFVIGKPKLDGLGDLVGADTPGADISTFRAAVSCDANSLNVRKNNPFRSIVCVADIIADRLFFATYLTRRHTSTPLSCI